jgi:hypothetical protein
VLATFTGVSFTSAEEAALPSSPTSSFTKFEEQHARERVARWLPSTHGREKADQHTHIGWAHFLRYRDGLDELIGRLSDRPILLVVSFRPEFRTRLVVAAT